MPVNDFNPVSPGSRGPSVTHEIFRSTPLRKYSTGVLANTGQFSLGTPAPAAAVGFYRCWDEADLTNAAEFSIDLDGTVTLVVPIWTGSTWVATDTGSGLNFFTSSGELIIENNSGGPLTLAIAQLI